MISRLSLCGIHALAPLNAFHISHTNGNAIRRTDIEQFGPTGCQQQARQAIFSAAVTYLFYFLTNPVGPVIVISTGMIFAKFFRVGRTMAVDDQSEISFFRSPKGRFQSDQFLLVLSTEILRTGLCVHEVLSTELIRWTQAASGAAGRANVALCLHLVQS